MSASSVFAVSDVSFHAALWSPSRLVVFLLSILQSQGGLGGLLSVDRFKSQARNSGTEVRNPENQFRPGRGEPTRPNSGKKFSNREETLQEWFSLMGRTSGFGLGFGCRGSFVWLGLWDSSCRLEGLGIRV